MATALGSKGSASLSSAVSSVMESTDRDQRVVRRLSSSGRALEHPPERKRPGRRCKPVRMLQSMCRSLPVLTPSFGRLHPAASSPARLTPSDSLLSHFMGSSGARTSAGRHMTGTLFGLRDGRVALALQANPRCRPALVLELALPTHALLRELGTTAGARIVLETEKRSRDGDGSSGRGGDAGRADDGWLLDEPIWSMSCSGKRVGYAKRREPTEDDIAVLETLWAVSMGGGVFPAGRSDAEGIDGEMAYMRGCFEHVIGSPDSESLYMTGPNGGDCPELAIFFVRQ